MASLVICVKKDCLGLVQACSVSEELRLLLMPVFQISNPHIFTAVIKAYLRELKDPLLCSQFANLWVEANKIKDRSEQVEYIKQLLAKLPEANRTNIGYLFQFLSKLVEEKDHNLMTTDNLVIVVGPNLLWSKDAGADDAFSINSALRIMIEGN